MFAFFLALLLATAQRNRSIRELKFEDFVYSQGKYYFDVVATKTGKTARYFHDERIYR